MNQIMRRIGILLFAFFLSANSFSAEHGNHKVMPLSINEAKDSVELQILYNGRAWRNLYYKVKGDQFLFLNEFLPGSVTIDDKTFNDLKLRYDIYDDELILISDHGIIIQLNKEMIDLFSVNFKNTSYYFKNFDKDSVNILSGYVNVLYEGNTSLYVKYRKELLQLAVENKYDMFNQINRVYIEKDGEVMKVDSRSELLKLLKDRKHELHNFIRSHKIKISKKYPESFIPVIEYYNKLGN